MCLSTIKVFPVGPHIHLTLIVDSKRIHHTTTTLWPFLHHTMHHVHKLCSEDYLTIALCKKAQVSKRILVLLFDWSCIEWSSNGVRALLVGEERVQYMLRQVRFNLHKIGKSEPALLDQQSPPAISNHHQQSAITTSNQQSQAAISNHKQPHRAHCTSC